MGVAKAPAPSQSWNLWYCTAAALAFVAVAIVVVVAGPRSDSILLSFALPDNRSNSPPPVDAAAAEIHAATSILSVPAGLLPPSFVPRASSGNLTARQAAVVAWGVQSSSKYLSRWRSLFANLSAETRDSYALFIYYYGRDAADQAAATAFLSDWASEADSVLVLVSTPAARNSAPDTWTSGRNVIASAMHAYEVARGRQFGWWGFADGDMCDMQCAGHEDVGDPKRSATCLTLVTEAAMGSPFALVSNLAHGNYERVPVPASNRTFLSPGPGFNVDGMFNIMNRRAIPVMLPYHEDLDSKSWWGSQIIMNWYFSSCLYGAVAGSSLAVKSKIMTSESAYPRGMVSDAELEETLRKSHPAFAERFFDARRKASQPIWRPIPFPPPHVIDLSVDKLPAWQESEDFAFCAKVRAPDFAAKIARGFPQAPAFSI